MYCIVHEILIPNTLIKNIHQKIRIILNPKVKKKKRKKGLDSWEMIVFVLDAKSLGWVYSILLLFIATWQDSSINDNNWLIPSCWQERLRQSGTSGKRNSGSLGEHVENVTTFITRSWETSLETHMLDCLAKDACTRFKTNKFLNTARTVQIFYSNCT